MSSADPKPPKRIRDPDALKRFRLEHLNELCDICQTRPGVDPHHVVFRSQGGDDVASNLRWLCRRCHDDVHNGRITRYDLG